MGPEKRLGPHVIAACRKGGRTLGGALWASWNGEYWMGHVSQAAVYPSWAAAKAVRTDGLHSDWELKIKTKEEWDRICVQELLIAVAR